jgi:hypothetical protein
MPIGAPTKRRSWQTSNGISPKLTLAIVDALRELLPDAALDPRFLRIIESGTGKTFTYDMNAAWDAATRPLLEAFFHAEYFLAMAVKYGRRTDRTTRNASERLGGAFASI